MTGQAGEVSTALRWNQNGATCASPCSHGSPSSIPGVPTVSTALSAYPNNRLTVRRMKPDRCTGAALLCPNRSAAATGDVGEAFGDHRRGYLSGRVGASPRLLPRHPAQQPYPRGLPRSTAIKCILWSLSRWIGGNNGCRSPSSSLSSPLLVRMKRLQTSSYH